MSKNEIGKAGEAPVGRILDDDQLEMVSGGNSMRHYFHRLTHAKVSRGKMLLDQFVQSIHAAPGQKRG
ncbi:hypothetical protein J5J86_19270 [Aquabacter sp. L1I39]|uniref:hypothetical protein n=1 Tax=Aquabacter sp. L1I39 TaxID=2820278 RepID=UPI001ADC8503|nr:hypothetical protein [Aquabacter sp. L1I39]QTL02885.1 hypothetical protein J5J86_19270 [Aquabacter sp. L1I39]